MTEVFVGSEAVAAAALTEHQLRSRNRAIFRGVYLPAWCDPTIDDYTIGAWLWSRKRAVVAGVAASALHGAQWVDAETPVELVAKSARPQPGLVVRNETLHAEEVTQVTCHSITLPVTTPARTAFDLGRHLPRGQALARLDALSRATPFSIEDVLMLAKRYRGARGLRRLNAVLPLIDGGAASPKESWLRLLLLDAGLPKPITQIPVHRGWQFVGLLDMGWEDYLVAVEYDGDQHRADRRQFVRDINRIAEMQKLGWVVIRVVAEHRPHDIIDRVSEALARRGYRRNRH